MSPLDQENTCEIWAIEEKIKHGLLSVLQVFFFILRTVIQNVADPRPNTRIGKVFELTEPRFRHDMERDFRIWTIFPDRDRNRNHDRILNHCLRISSPNINDAKESWYT